MPDGVAAPALDLSGSDLQTAFAGDVRHGLSAAQKSLPCKYLYDARGAALFERICELDEYYPTRTELQIMRRYVDSMAEAIGPGALLAELGSGAAVKTRMLLDHLRCPAAYVPIDIARDQLGRVADAIARDYPGLQVRPVHADFESRFALPALAAARRVVYFPGSTIGNFEPGAAAALLGRLHDVVGTGGGLLIGLDLKKEPNVLHAAYNDAGGATAAFNLNLLHRINSELDGTFDTGQFAHYAAYDPVHGRVNMYLVSKRRQTVRAAGERFAFSLGEPIHTEHSHKYEPSEFARQASAAGFRLRHTWTDDRRWFAVQLYGATDRGRPGTRPPA